MSVDFGMGPNVASKKEKSYGGNCNSRNTEILVFKTNSVTLIFTGRTWTCSWNLHTTDKNSEQYCALLEVPTIEWFHCLQFFSQIWHSFEAVWLFLETLEYIYVGIKAETLINWTIITLRSSIYLCQNLFVYYFYPKLSTSKNQFLFTIWHLIFLLDRIY